MRERPLAFVRSLIRANEHVFLRDRCSSGRRSGLGSASYASRGTYNRCLREAGLSLQEWMSLLTWIILECLCCALPKRSLRLSHSSRSSVRVPYALHSMHFYQELDVFGAVPVRKKDEILEAIL